MKNFSKVLGFIALVAIIGFSMAACGGDDSGGSTSVEGTWVLKYKDAPGWADFKDMAGMMGIKGDDVAQQIFFSNGNFTSTEYDKDGTPNESTGTYTVDGSTVKMTTGGETTTATIKGKKLTFTGDDHGETVTVSFTKK